MEGEENLVADFQCTFAQWETLHCCSLFWFIKADKENELDSVDMPRVEHVSVLSSGSVLKGHKEATLLREGVWDLGALGSWRPLLCFLSKGDFSKDSLGLRRTMERWWQEHLVENTTWLPGNRHSMGWGLQECLFPGKHVAPAGPVPPVSHCGFDFWINK